MVFHPPVVEDIRANLASPLYLFLRSLYLSLCLQAFLHGTVVELRLQEGHGTLLVLRLVACLGILDKDFLFLARIRVGIPIAQSHS